VVLGILIVKVSRSHSDTPRSVRLLCKSDRPIVKTSSWQHTIRQTFMVPVGFEPAIPASERPQIHALNYVWLALIIINLLNEQLKFNYLPKPKMKQYVSPA